MELATGSCRRNGQPLLEAQAATATATGCKGYHPVAHGGQEHGLEPWFAIAAVSASKSLQMVLAAYHR